MLRTELIMLLAHNQLKIHCQRIFELNIHFLQILGLLKSKHSLDPQK